MKICFFLDRKKADFVNGCRGKVSSISLFFSHFLFTLALVKPANSFLSVFVLKVLVCDDRILQGYMWRIDVG